MTISVLTNVFLYRGFNACANVLRLILRFTSFRRRIAPLSTIGERGTTLLHFLHRNRVNLTIHVFPTVRMVRMKFKRMFTLTFTLVARQFTRRCILLIRHVPFTRYLNGNNRRPNMFVMPICIDKMFVRQILRTRSDHVLSIFNVCRTSALIIFRKRMGILRSTLTLSSYTGNVCQCNRAHTCDHGGR